MDAGGWCLGWDTEVRLKAPITIRLFAASSAAIAALQQPYFLQGKACDSSVDSYGCCVNEFQHCTTITPVYEVIQNPHRIHNPQLSRVVLHLSSDSTRSHTEAHTRSPHQTIDGCEGYRGAIFQRSYPPHTHLSTGRKQRASYKAVYKSSVSQCFAWLGAGMALDASRMQGGRWLEECIYARGYGCGSW